MAKGKLEAYTARLFMFTIRYLLNYSKIERRGILKKIRCKAFFSGNLLARSKLQHCKGLILQLVSECRSFD